MKSVRSKVVSAAAGRSWWLSEEARARGEAPDAHWAESEPGVVYFGGEAFDLELVLAVARDLAQALALKQPGAANTGAMTQAILGVLAQSPTPLSVRQVAEALKYSPVSVRGMLRDMAIKGTVEKHKEGPGALDRVTYSRTTPR